MSRRATAIRVLDAARALGATVPELRERHPDLDLGSAAARLSESQISTLLTSTQAREALRRPTQRRAEPPAHSGTLITAREAESFGIAPAATVRKWASRGLVAKAGRRGRADLYRRGDLETLRWSTSSRTAATARSQAQMPTYAVLQSGSIDTEAAARLADVSPSTIRMWVQRGHLTPIEMAKPERGHRFKVSAVVEASQNRQARAVRRS